jgi:hypothetical protein
LRSTGRRQFDSSHARPHAACRFIDRRAVVLKDAGGMSPSLAALRTVRTTVGTGFAGSAIDRAGVRSVGDTIVEDGAVSADNRVVTRAGWLPLARRTPAAGLPITATVSRHVAG